jgi:hypothetical protein
MYLLRSAEIQSQDCQILSHRQRGVVGALERYHGQQPWQSIALLICHLNKPLVQRCLATRRADTFSAKARIELALLRPLSYGCDIATCAHSRADIGQVCWRLPCPLAALLMVSLVTCYQAGT